MNVSNDEASVNICLLVNAPVEEVLRRQIVNLRSGSALRSNFAWETTAWYPKGRLI